MARNYFKALHSYLELIEPLKDAERGRLFTALLKYSKTGAMEKLSGNERFVFMALKADIDREMEKCAEITQKRREAGIKGVAAKQMLANASKCQQMLANAYSKEKEKERTKEKEKEIIKEKGRVFTYVNTLPKKKDGNCHKNMANAIQPLENFQKPTQKEISDYCLKRNNGIDAKEFIDFYESKGWMIGKNRMQNWKAAVRNWERARKNKQGDTNLEQQREKTQFSKIDFINGEEVTYFE